MYTEYTCAQQIKWRPTWSILRLSLVLFLLSSLSTASSSLPVLLSVKRGETKNCEKMSNAPLMCTANQRQQTARGKTGEKTARLDAVLRVVRQRPIDRSGPTTNELGDKRKEANIFACFF